MKAAEQIESWPRVRLDEVLAATERGEDVDASRNYRLLGVRLDGQGPFLRETVTGTQTSATKLYRVCKGDFIYSRLFACRGAFGVIGKDLDGCYVSGEFPTFVPVPGKVDVQYLKYWFRLPSVIAAVDEDCSGSTPLTRNRFKENFFLSLEIPLPPLPEQQRIVARIEELAAQIDEARALRQQAIAEVEALTSSFRRAKFGETPRADWIPLGDYVESIQNGKSPATEGRRASPDEWAVLKVGAVSFGVFDDQENKALPVSFAVPASLEVRAGDFIMSRANTVELVGACALVRKTRPRLILSDKTFRFVFRKSPQCLPEYMEQVLKSPALRTQIESGASGTSPTMKNISKEKVLALRLPPFSLAQQRQIVAEASRLEEEVHGLKHLQTETAAALDALLPAVLDRAFKGEL